MYDGRCFKQWYKYYKMKEKASTKTKNYNDK